ncbi:MAG: hypothetical protein KME17_12145 [Cyanosarcina radialis HA8281-LM2]|jgi:hypothetical protein|nr:hypothetical protein [Cyanosarcina radialis HA8281-LM2]
MNAIGKKVIQQLGLALSLSSVTLLTSLAFTAQAKDGDNRVIRTGNCSGTSDWKLKAKSDNGRIEVEFEVDQNVVGRTWSNVIRNNGRVIFTGNRVTQPPSGSYSIEFLTNNLPGNDVITATARNLSTGELCSGSVVFSF